MFYVICAVWVLSLAIVMWGLRSLKYLRAVPTYAGREIKVSVIVAARNEADTIEQALHSLLHQDYPNYDVVVANDRSSDSTGAILQRMQREFPQLQVVEIEDLPARWLGKNNALHVAAANATGNYILFTDADVVMQPSTLSRAVSFCETNRIDHLAVFPALPAPSYWTGACFSLFGLGFLMMTQPWFARNGKTPMPVGVGAFNFVRRRKYAEIGGHSTIALRPDDDLALAFRLRNAGSRQDILIGVDQVSVEWYPNFGAFIRGLEKNAFAPFRYSMLPVTVAMLLHFMAYVVPWLGLFLGGRATWVCGLTVAAQMLTLSATAPVADRPWRFAPVILFASLTFEYAVFRAVFLTLKRGGIQWRDTFYPLDLLKTNPLD
ncbi:MAG TPA: glycosyltransferase [Longimicrobiales bacterium]|nr:glycosyltransferase [Longimicrobiales bacterium]